MLNRIETTAGQGFTAVGGNGGDDDHHGHDHDHDHKRRVQAVSGKTLAYLMRGKSKVACAIAGARLINEGLGVARLTHKQVAALFGVNLTYLNTALSLTPEEHLAALKADHFPPARADVERLVGRADPEVTWDALVHALD